MEAVHSLIGNKLIINDDIKSGSTDLPYYHYHDVYEIYLLLDGRRYMIIDGNVFETNSGDAAIIRPGDFTEATAMPITEEFVLIFPTIILTDTILLRLNQSL